MVFTVSKIVVTNGNIDSHTLVNLRISILSSYIFTVLALVTQRHYRAHLQGAQAVFSAKNAPF